MGPAIAVAVFVAGPGAQYLLAPCHLLRRGKRHRLTDFVWEDRGRKRINWYTVQCTLVKILFDKSKTQISTEMTKMSME